MPFLIDSNVLIDVSRGNAAAIKYVDGLTEPWVLSQVTALELIVGARDRRDPVVIDGLLVALSGRAAHRRHRNESVRTSEDVRKITRPSRFRFSHRRDRHGERLHLGHAESKALSDGRRPQTSIARLLAVQ